MQWERRWHKLPHGRRRLVFWERGPDRLVDGVMTEQWRVNDMFSVPFSPEAVAELRVVVCGDWEP